jgi:hypothetical protein
MQSLVIWLVPIGLFPLKQAALARALCSEANEHGAITGALACSHWLVPSRGNSDCLSSLQQST